MDSLSIGVLYRLTRASGNPSIHVQGGNVNIYGAFAEPSSSPVTDSMSLSKSNFTGIDQLCVIPPFIYIEQSSGETSYIKVDGINARSV